MASTNHNQGVPDTSEHVNVISFQVVIEGRDHLPGVLHSEEVTKCVAIENSHTEPASI